MYYVERANMDYNLKKSTKQAKDLQINAVLHASVAHGA